jgi:hypothetical protein
VDQSGIDQKIDELVPGYMPMGVTGMGDMPDMGGPRNSLFMAGGDGPFGTIFMGGMFTIVKIREHLASYDEDPGWYQNPPGTVASPVGARQTLGPTGPVPPHPRSALADLLPTTTIFSAVRAGSCASMMKRR